MKLFLTLLFVSLFTEATFYSEPAQAQSMAELYSMNFTKRYVYINRDKGCAYVSNKKDDWANLVLALETSPQ